jgi:SNF family Na+-dependent transporter
MDIRNLALSGTELSFNIFPKALAILAWPNLWVFLFFLAMVFLGIDS